MQLMCAEKTFISVFPQHPPHIPTPPGCHQLPDCLYKGVCSPKESIGDRPHISLGIEELFRQMKLVGCYCVVVVAMWARKIYVDPWWLCIGLGKKYLLHTYATYDAYYTYKIMLHRLTRASTSEHEPASPHTEQQREQNRGEKKRKEPDEVSIKVKR